MATAKEIAKIIGVSQATLSLVVNNKPGISENTRSRVLRELKNRGYSYLINVKEAPSKNMPSDNSTIAFVIYQVEGELLGYNSFFPLIMSGIEGRAREHGYNVSFINVSREKIEEGVKHIKASRCCGYIIFATEMHESDLEPFQKLNLPFVLLDNNFNDDVNLIKVNNEQGTYMAAKYLIDKGHRRIGYLKSGLQIRSFEERCRMALYALQKLGAETPEKYVYQTGYPIENAYENMKELLSREKELPTAFLADNDIVAAGAMKACRELGYRVPEEVSFVGFDDRPVCTMVDPPLTTMQIPREYFGAEAVELLIRVIHGETALSLKVEVNSKLIVRDSVADRKDSENE